MNDRSSKNGFAGLIDLATDINGMGKLPPRPSASPPDQSPPPQPPATAPTSPFRLSTLATWLLPILIIALFLWATSAKNTPSPRYSPPTTARLPAQPAPSAPSLPQPNSDDPSNSRKPGIYSTYRNRPSAPAASSTPSPPQPNSDSPSNSRKPGIYSTYRNRPSAPAAPSSSQQPSTAAQPLPALTTTQTPSAPATIITPSPATPSAPLYDQPPPGTDNTLTISQLRWCLREKIRLDAMHPRATTNRAINHYNNLVQAFNIRCNTYTYYRNDFTNAQRTIEQNRTQIITDAIIEINTRR